MTDEPAPLSLRALYDQIMTEAVRLHKMIVTCPNSSAALRKRAVGLISDLANRRLQFSDSLAEADAILATVTPQKGCDLETMMREFVGARRNGS
jgi:hypothetical protein